MSTADSATKFFSACIRAVTKSAFTVTVTEEMPLFERRSVYLFSVPLSKPKNIKMPKNLSIKSSDLEKIATIFRIEKILAQYHARQK